MKPEVLTSVTGMLAIVTVIALAAEGAISVELGIAAVVSIAGLGGYKAWAQFKNGRK